MPASPLNLWWKTYFSRLYGRLYAGPLGGDLATAEEVALLQRVFADTGPILDICCGYGRHLAPLNAAGLEVYGLDYSLDLLRDIPKRPRRRTVRGDMRRLPWPDGTFAGAYMLFNSFGYFEPQENAAVLREIARVLKPGAKFAIDAASRQGMTEVVEETPVSIRVEDGFSMSEAWGISAETGRLEARGCWQEGSTTQDWDLSLALHTPAEMLALLKENGFRGRIEVRPMEQLEKLGTGARAPSPNAATWEKNTNMIILAER